MNFLKSIFDKFGISFSWKGNKKMIVKQSGADVQAHQGQGVMTILNIKNVTVAQIEDLAKPDQTINQFQNAGARFLAEQLTMQGFLKDTVNKASLATIKNPAKLDAEWFLKWMDVAKRVGRDEIQAVLAKILSGEVQLPGSYSLRTLEVVKNLSHDELAAFQAFLALSTEQGFYFIGALSDAATLQKYDLTFALYAHLAEIGLFNSSATLYMTFDIESNAPQVIQIGDKSLIISATPKKSLRLDILKFTSVGREIYLLLYESSKNARKDIYVDDLIKHIKDKGFNVEKSDAPRPATIVQRP